MKLRSVTRALACAIIALCAASAVNGQTFQTIQPMNFDRAFGTSVGLSDGTVLLVGGSQLDPTTEVDIYNPVGQTFTELLPTGLLTPLFGTAGVLLNDGTVLVVGMPQSSDEAQYAAEIYDPTKQKFERTTGLMNTIRQFSSATLLPDGTVLIAGGQDTSFNDLNTAEIYNPITGHFTRTVNNMHADRYWHTATLMKPGKTPGPMDNLVILAGGADGSGNARNGVETYNYLTGQFSFLGAMVIHRYGQVAYQTPEGNLVIAGGCLNFTYDATPLAEIYNPTTNTFTQLPNAMTTSRCFPTGTVLADGSFLITGGTSGPHADAISSSAEVFTYGNNIFTAVGSMSAPAAAGNAVALPYDPTQASATVLVTGGVIANTGENTPGGTPTSAAQLYTYSYEGGTINPKYLVMSVEYAPPGSGSTVTYSRSTSVGNTSSITDSFASEDVLTYGLSGGGSIGTGGPTINIGESFTNQWTDTIASLSSIATTSTTGNGVVANGPETLLGLDHDYDVITLWLNPQVKLAIPANTAQPELLWSGYQSDANDPNQTPAPDIIEIPVYCLKNPYYSPGSLDCTQYVNYLTRYWDAAGQGGLTQNDIAQILRADPFVTNPNYDPAANDQVTTNRYAYISSAGFFQPAPDGGPMQYPGTITNTTVLTDSTTATNQYTTSVTLTGSIGFKSVIKAQVSNMQSNTWTNQLSSSASQTNTSIASYNVNAPADNSGYVGPRTFNIYQDALYGTFMFYSNLTDPVPPASLDISPSALVFPTAVEPGQISSPQSVTLTNVSSVPMQMQSPAVTSSVQVIPATSTCPQDEIIAKGALCAVPYFQIAPGADGCSGTTLPANGTCTVSIEFAPFSTATAGSISGTLIAAGAEEPLGTTTTVLITNNIGLSGTVTNATTGTSLSITPQTIVEGGAVTLSATVTAPGGVAPTGTVQFMNNSVVAGTATLNSYGVATLNLSTAGVPPGVYSGIANYLGSSSLPPSSSSAVALTVLGSATPVSTAPPVAVTTMTGNMADSITAADFDKNGSLDAAVAYLEDNVVRVILNTTGTTTSYAVGNQPYDVVSGDLNGDGYSDLVTANTGDGTVSVLLNNGNGTFATAVAYPAGRSPFKVAIGDLNGDGVPDLAITNNGDNTVSILYGVTGGTFVAGPTLSTAAQPYGIVIGDFAKTGHNGIAVTCFSTSQLYVFPNKGNGTFGSPNIYTTDSNPAGLVVGDFNGDGRLDIVTGNTTANDISFFSGNGDDTFQPGVISPSLNHPVSIAAGDINGDGILDIVGVAPNYQEVVVTLGVGDGTFGTISQREPFLAGQQPWAVVLGDFYNNGKLDIATANTYNPVDLDTVQQQQRYETEFPPVSGGNPSAFFIQNTTK